MKYKIGDIVHNSNGLMVEIIDRETICDVNLYYTSDNTSYPEHKLSPNFNIPKNKVDYFIKCFKSTELQPRTYEEYRKDNSTITTNRITYWFRKTIHYFSQSH